MPPQLCCGDTCQIQTRFSKADVCFDNTEKFGKKRNGGNWLRKPHPDLQCQYHACWCSGDPRGQIITRHCSHPDYSVSSIRIVKTRVPPPPPKKKKKKKNGRIFVGDVFNVFSAETIHSYWFWKDPITLTPYMVFPLFATRCAACAGGILVSFIQTHLILFDIKCSAWERYHTDLYGWNV